MNTQDKNELDALRYRALRKLAIDDGELESWVALNALDFIPTSDEFDETVDSLIDWRKGAI